MIYFFEHQNRIILQAGSDEAGSVRDDAMEDDAMEDDTMEDGTMEDDAPVDVGMGDDAMIAEEGDGDDATSSGRYSPSECCEAVAEEGPDAESDNESIDAPTLRLGGGLLSDGVEPIDDDDQSSMPPLQSGHMEEICKDEGADEPNPKSPSMKSEDSNTLFETPQYGNSGPPRAELVEMCLGLLQFISQEHPEIIKCLDSIKCKLTFFSFALILLVHMLRLATDSLGATTW